MPVYWSLFIISFLSFLFSIPDPEGIRNHRAMIFTLLVTLIIASCRDVVQDTYAYVMMFEELPLNWASFFDQYKMDNPLWGFCLFTTAFKIYFVENHYLWFAFICGSSIYAIYYSFKRYSVDPAFSVFLFISSTSFTWLLNGMRQFWVVCILFAFSNWLLEGKKIKFLILVFLLGFIHRSSWFIIPIIWFVSAEEIFNKRIFLVVFFTGVGLLISDSVFSSVMEFTGKDYTQSLESGGGSNIIRFLVAAVPTVIAFFNKEKLTDSPKHIKLAVNMSLVGACFMFASTFTNGVLIGRMPIYFFLYNYFLLPYLIRKCFLEMETQIVFYCIFFYSLFFYFQMCIAWKGLPYVSYILNINV